jgi:hypothetical protein
MSGIAIAARHATSSSVSGSVHCSDRNVGSGRVAPRTLAAHAGSASHLQERIDVADALDDHHEHLVISRKLEPLEHFWVLVAPGKH